MQRNCTREVADAAVLADAVECSWCMQCNAAVLLHIIAAELSKVLR